MSNSNRRQTGPLQLHGTTGRPADDHYDVVIVGARAAGAATAMLLADHGLRVLAVDRQAYGSDTLSTHALMRGAVARLANWGLLESLFDADTPVIGSTTFTYGAQTIDLDVRSEPGMPGLIAPRRTLLDATLVDAARAAGAEVLHKTAVRGLHRDGTGRVNGLAMVTADGHELSVSTDLVIGADGLRSAVARAVGAPITRSGHHASAYTIQYYTDLPVDQHAFHWLYRLGRGAGVIPTTDNSVCVFTGMRPGVFATEGRGDVTAAHHANLVELDPALAELVAAATPLGRIRSWPGVRGQFRKPFGPGWALVGDAGYFKDPYAAHGITDAFRDAELLTDAVLSGDFAGYETKRDELSMPLFEVLDRIASYDWDLEELPGLHYKLSKAMKAEDESTLGRARGLRLAA